MMALVAHRPHPAHTWHSRDSLQVLARAARAPTGGTPAALATPEHAQPTPYPTCRARAEACSAPESTLATPMT